MSYYPPTWNKPIKECFCVISTGVNNIQVFYFFDAVLRAEHNQELAITEHPTQAGANVSDHAYLLPARVTLEISMSDAVAVYTTQQGITYPYSDDPSKSKSAYHAFLNLQIQRTPLQLWTRLNRYKNMLVQVIRSAEDFKTINSLNATLIFKQILIGAANTQIRPAKDQTDAILTTKGGTAQPGSPSAPVAQVFSGSYVAGLAGDITTLR
jgi:hypothetical protein